MRRILTLVALLSACEAKDGGAAADTASDATDGGDGADTGDGTDGADGTDAGDGSDGADGSDGTDGGGATGCSGGAGLERGDRFLNTPDGASFWVLYTEPVPDCAPLLVFLHGGDSVGGYDRGLWRSPLPTGVDVKSNEWGYALLVPYLEEAASTTHSWSADPADEQAELEAMIDSLATQANINLDRVMFVGHGEGGDVATWLALNAPARMERATTVGAGLGCAGFGYPATEPSPKLPFYAAHDPADSVRPYSCTETLELELTTHGHDIDVDSRALGADGHGWVPDLTDALLEAWLTERTPPTR